MSHIAFGQRNGPASILDVVLNGVSSIAMLLVKLEQYCVLIMLSEKADSQLSFDPNTVKVCSIALVGRWKHTFTHFFLMLQLFPVNLTMKSEKVKWNLKSPFGNFNSWNDKSSEI